MKKIISVLSFFLFLCSEFASAGSALPNCVAHGQILNVNNAQVLQWKKSSPNHFLARAHVQGQIQKLFADQHGHNHFLIQIGAAPTDNLEVIYNIEFGTLPSLAIGMSVEACGDYITSTAPAGPYPASPAGAIIHWVHYNPNGHGHDGGYVAIDGNLYGQTGGQRR